MKKPLAILSLAAIALLAAGCNKSTDSTSQSNTNTNSVTPTQTSQNTQAQISLRQDMRKLWTDHVLWTREYLVAASLNAPNAQDAATRLLKNQEDIGAAVGTYYGTEAGNKLTALLKDHINIAVSLIADAKANNTTKFNTDNDKWEQNANDIADFLSRANPANWPQATLREMMAKHLATLTQQVTDTLNKKYDASVTDFDAGYDHILTMADALSDGIIKQFPDKFN